MNIIIEGPDATGKSTLAHKLARYLNWPVFESPGPTQDEFIFNQRLLNCLSANNTIFDRHPAVSERIYGRLRGNVIADPGYVEMYKASTKFVIYCRPPHQLPHILKPYDTKEHLKLLEAPQLLRFYDEWAIQEADYVYRGDSLKPLFGVLSHLASHKSPDYFQDVHDFREKFNISYDGKPRVLPPELYTAQHSHLVEELIEWSNTCARAIDETTRSPMHRDRANITHHLSQSLDALVDLVYVAMGTAILSGFNFPEAWRRVHRANMMKQQSGAGAKQGIVKPEGWEAPNHDDLVEDHAHR